MAWVAREVRSTGYYVGRNKAMDQGTYTTAERAKSAMLIALNDVNAPVPTDDDYEKGLRVIQWIRGDEAYEIVNGLNPDFARQMFAATASDDEVLEENGLAIVASAIAFYNRANQDSAPAQKGQHIGTVGDKIDILVTVERVNMIEGQYGFTTFVNMRDEAGNLLLWPASRDPKMEVGKTYMIHGTIKKHDFDNYKKEDVTRVTRCKIMSEVPA